MKTSVTQGRREDSVLFFSSLFAFLFILLFPQRASDGVRTGLILCSRAVIPAVFPSMILTELLFSYPFGFLEKTVGKFFSKLFRISPRGVVSYLSGLLSGFPIGAKTVCEDVRCGYLSPEEGERLLVFCNNTGPAFLVGGVGVGLFGSARVGWFLYLLQIPVSIVVGIFNRPKESAPQRTVTDHRVHSHDPVGAIARAAHSCVSITGFVCFFSVLSSLLSSFLVNPNANALLSSFLEVGSGSSRAAALTAPFPALPITAFAVCFSGFSVHFQTISLLSPLGIRPERYLIGKTVSGVIAFFLTFLLTLDKSFFLW